ncbi:peroxisomal carnitine O-octanoyltransferase [Aplysia californica]|uniref:Peroxisomal carnitine O-octanoyltransferase n=1 Tax=Aplysia californica TaxID=6500 RepID=A0ABM0JE49_APLCA|nr:peroxisomal carnitine O-octanoyltransferase [Aplysia californica]
MEGNDRYRRRRSTTRKVEITADIGPRDLGNVDIDLRRALFNREGHRESSMCSGISIKPKPSIAQGVPKDAIGKRVWFASDTKFKSPVSDSETDQRSAKIRQRLKTTWPVSRDDVTQSLNEKSHCVRDSVDSYKMFVQKYVNPESPRSSVSDDNSEHRSLESPKHKEHSTSFAGNLEQVDASRLHGLDSEPKEPINKHIPGLSTRPHFSESASYLSDDVWPWPWLDPKKRSYEVYVDMTVEKVTFSQQSQLRKAKVPLLARTLKRYLESVKPCVLEAQFAATKIIVENFALSAGKKYNEQLLENVEGSKDWQKTALPNYTHVFSQQEQPLRNISIVLPLMNDLWPAKEGTQLERSTLLIKLTLDFWKLLREQHLRPLTGDDKAYVCMHSFRKLFSSCRIPGIPEDGIAATFRCTGDIEETPKHFVVICRGNFFIVDGVDEDGRVIGINVIRQSLEEMVRSMESGLIDEAPGIGVLTSANKNKWSWARDVLMSISEDNAGNLQLIEQAIFVISLDHLNANPSKISHEAVFADGCNRWYDKGLSFYVYANGLVTASVNRLLQDGLAVAALLDYIHLRVMEDAEKWDDDVAISISQCALSSPGFLTDTDDFFLKLGARASEISNLAWTSEQSSSVRTSTSSFLGGPRVLVFDINDFIEGEIETAKRTFASLQAALCSAECTYDRLEKNLLQKRGIHPDAFAHLVMHLTYFRMYFRLGAIGTRVHLRRLYHGRYELMRSATPQILAWCKVMMSPDADQALKASAFWVAEKQHEQIYEENVSGQGIENHLTSLKLIGDLMDGAVPELFRDESYLLSGGDERFPVFAESLGDNFLSVPVVVPTHTKGYGVGYTVVNGRISFHVTSWNDEPSTSADLFAASLYRTLETNHDFFLSL